MHRIAAGVLVVMLVLCLFAGCQTDMAKISVSKETEAEIIHAYWEKYCRIKSIPEHYLAIRVYGVFEDAYVFFMDGGEKRELYEEETVTVADVAFHYPSTLRLRVYHAGKIYELQAAYEAGILSTKDLEALPHTFPENYFLTLSDEIKAEIAAVYSPSPLTEDHWLNPEEVGKRHLRKLEYLGTYNDYVILFRLGDIAAIESETIAGYTFYSTSGFSLRGYKNGEFYEVKLLYRDSELTDEDIAAIHRKCRQYN